jgi:hypothetical protein
MTTCGKLEHFNQTEGDWDTYVERDEQYFIVNDIDRAR